MESAEVREAERATLLTLFNCSPEDFAWPSATCDHIEARRAQMNDQLIFDVLLATGGIHGPDRLYPPRDVDALIVLMDAILDSTYDLLKKDCLIYYLMQFHKDGREEVFSEEHSIPPQFVLLADAYWQLDNGADVPRAVSILSDLRLNRDYPSKIFQAISLTENANPLILKYVRTAKPILTEPMDIELFTVALAESSLLDAWQYQRTFPEISDMRPRLVHKILEWCLTPQPRPVPLTQLLGFPFSSYEENLIHEYALQPPSSLPSSARPVIQDLICVRLIQSGNYASAIKLDRRFAANVIPDMTPKMEKAIQERRAMVDELLGTLPAVERSMLDADMEAEANGGAAPEPSFFDKSRDLQDLTMSWEDVPSPSAAIAITVPPPKPSAPKDLSIYCGAPSTSIAARNDLPRFGASTSANGNAFAPISTSISSSHQPQSAFTPHSSLSGGLSASQGSRVPAPLLGSSGIKYPTPLFSHSGSSTSARNPPAASKPASSFTLGGSANQTRNAFYTPPTTNGTKRALVEDEPRAFDAPNPADAPPVPVMDADISMDTDEEREPAADSSRTNGANSAPAELSYSVFGGSSSLPKQPPLKTRRVGRAEPTQKVHMPPGAFHADEDETPASAVQPAPSRSRTVSPGPPPAQSRQPNARKPASRKKQEDLTRSVPGAFVDEDNEEEDYVAPLPGSPPPGKRPNRKPRASRSLIAEDDDAPRATRRSTRISAASSVASTSPEPSPPKKAITKGRKSTRTSSKK
ncbi:hypothetical protein FIBSPDRAFT_1046417 [Athelia psychrophila]|uniref:ELYS-like domain-containing protein n=1 Tax=Athelia psychrophila TaxID=1759441 RepID=A0A166GVA2_9AGAM|nr:hypothetical protein FIBSPDRAFT_1046417 [Fibularhizoctonia sp. CBS 109695]